MSQPGKKGLRSSSPRRTESPIRTSASPSIKRPVSGRPSLGAGPKTPGKVPIPPSVSSPKTSPRRFQSAGAALKSPSPISYAAHRMAKVGGSMVPSPPRSSSDSPNQLESRLSFNNPARLRAYASADDAANVDVKPSTSSGSRWVLISTNFQRVFAPNALGA